MRSAARVGCFGPLGVGDRGGGNLAACSEATIADRMQPIGGHQRHPSRVGVRGAVPLRERTPRILSTAPAGLILGQRSTQIIDGLAQTLELFGLWLVVSG